MPPGVPSNASDEAYEDPKVTPSDCNHVLSTVLRTATLTFVTPTSSVAVPDNTTSDPINTAPLAGISTNPSGGELSGATTVKST